MSIEREQKSKGKKAKEEKISKLGFFLSDDTHNYLNSDGSIPYFLSMR